MGCVTPLVINNDFFCQLERNPSDFVSAINELMNIGGRNHKFGIDVKLARHSSQHGLFATKHSLMYELDPYSKDFKEAVKKNPETMREILNKAKDQVEEALRFMDEKEPPHTEIEVRYLVEKAPKNLKHYPKIEITQGYFASEDATIRVRFTSEIKGYLTIKGPKKGAACDEFEYEIPYTHARTMYRRYCTSGISKTRYHIPTDGLIVEFDVFKGDRKGLMIAEVELPSKNTKFAAPDWFGEEITSNREYSNKNLASKSDRK